MIRKLGCYNTILVNSCPGSIVAGPCQWFVARIDILQLERIPCHDDSTGFRGDFQNRGGRSRLCIRLRGLGFGRGRLCWRLRCRRSRLCYRHSGLRCRCSRLCYRYSGLRCRCSRLCCRHSRLRCGHSGFFGRGCGHGGACRNIRKGCRCVRSDRGLRRNWITAWIRWRSSSFRSRGLRRPECRFTARIGNGH